MKKFITISAVAAMLLSALASCQKVEEISKAPEPVITHTVKFTTEIDTKTSYNVDGTTVKYQWDDADIERFKVFEDGMTQGTIITEGDDKSYIDVDGILHLTVTFKGTGEGSHIYTANLNGGVVKSEQIAANDTYDPTCDVLVAKPTSSTTFSFRRPVAITELKLKGLNAGEEVSKVTIISDSDHPLVGTYTQDSDDDTKGEWSNTSNKLVVMFGTELDGTTPSTKTVGEDGTLPLSIVTKTMENASVKVLVETENGLKYRKVTTPALKLLADVVKVQGIGLTSVTEAEHAEDGWYLVTDANELFDGDEIRIACTSENMMAGDFAVDKDSKTQTYLANCAVSFNEGKLTGVTPGSEPQIFTLSEGYGKWNITTANGKLGATAARSLKYNEGSLNWGISIGDEGVATISSETDDYGDIQYNASSPRFLNYASEQTDIQIFKKYGTPEDPVIKIARTASFSTEKATVTIDAQGNVFPELSFEPEEATGGEQTWTSSNTEVATVNATTGEVTLVSDGTTTISVEIGESETYQPCSAEYVLTVNPAAVAGEDYLDWAFTNVTSYTDWTNTGSASGNTYAGQSTKFKSDDKNNKDKIDAIQMRTTNSNSGIVVKESPNDKVARKITVGWNSYTNEKTLDIYGKSTAYSSAADLYSSEAATQGTYLGSIVEGTSTELTISGDYEFIGIRSKDGALYLNWIKIQWEDPKPEYEACFKNGDATVEEVYGTVGETFTAPTLSIDGGLTPTVTYESSNKEVATVDAESGAVTLKKKGDATITATLDGDDTHKTTTASYTLHVANVLSSIKLADDSEQPTTFYVDQDFNFAGIKLEAEYNDGEKKTLTADDLTADNFSGFDSSAAVESQTITVSYTDGATETTTYNVEIKPLVALYGITVPAEDANGNSITVKGGLTEAPEGAEIELDVNPNTEKGYKLTSLEVNEVEHSADVAEGKYTFTMPAEAVTVTASFDNHYNVVLGSATNGSFTVNGGSASPVSVVYGTTVNLVATPATGYVFKAWTVEGATVASATAATTTFTMPASEVTVNAMFAEPLPTIVIDLNASGASGSSYSNSNFVVGGVSFSAYDWMKSTNFIQAKASTNPSLINTTEIPGIIKSITVVTGSGKTARAVTVYGGTSSTLLTEQITSPTTAMTMVFDFSGKSYSYFKLATPGNACYFDNITIEYDPSGYTPTNYSVSIANDIQNGSVSATPTSATAGTEITLTATPDDGYSFGSWDVKDASNNPITVTDNKFRMPASNVTVSATFTQGSTSGDTYVLCTSTSDLVAGADYIIANGTSGSVNCISTESNNNNRKVVEATVVNSTIDVSSTPAIMVLTLGGSTGAWTLYTKNYAGTKGYLASAASGSNNYCRVISTSTTCTISFSSNAAVITLQPHTSRNILMYNTSSSLFACYSSGQSKVYLYKKSN